MSLVQRFKYEGTDAEEEVGGYKKVKRSDMKGENYLKKVFFGECVVFFKLKQSFLKESLGVYCDVCV